MSRRTRARKKAVTTFIEEVHKRFPGLTDDEADSVLWGATCFPFGCADRVLKDLDAIATASGGDAGLALRQADDEMDLALRDIHFNELESTIQPS